MVKEAKARIKINRLLENSGWRFDDSAAGRANILLEEKTELDDDKRGAIDYLLLGDNQRPICVLEAKRESLHPYIAKEQARKYATAKKCPFVILSNGISHYFWDVKHDEPQLITKFPSPSSLQERVKYSQNPQQLSDAKVDASYLAARLLRDYQIEAIDAVQKAAKKGKTRFLLEMATGTGKTTIAAALCKLFISTGQAHRILFLVDRIELENQAEKNFREMFKDNYNIRKYKSGEWRSAHVVVSTVQSLLKDNKYREQFSPTDFNLIISDEAHRSLGGKSRAVFEYFLGYKLGLTATPKDYMKGTDEKDMSAKNPKEWERRNMQDTYKTFGCEGSEPTYRYDLVAGVQNDVLINPLVLDARTNITTQLLSDKGYAIPTPPDDDEDSEVAIYDFKDYEVKFINNNTNRVLCNAILRNGLCDPITDEFGKTLIFCVRCYHATRITEMLNQCAREMYPGKYAESDFAVQVTSDVPDAQKHAKDFANNRLLGRSHFAEDTHPDYDTSKARVCVTVGMMTTGYDCPDLLNVVLLRPIFSPSDFIQMKGRGTRKRTFHYQETGEKAEKTKFLLFDCFANCEYFHKDFNYDDKLELPQDGGIGDDAPTGDGDRTDDTSPAIPPNVIDTTPDNIRTQTYIHIGNEDMEISARLPLHEQFENVMRDSTQIRAILEKGDMDDVLEFVKANVLNEERGWTAAKIRESYERKYRPDRKISLSDMVLMACHKTDFKTRQDRIDEEFQKFCDIQKLEFSVEQSGQADTLKEFFETYLSDSDFRKIIKSDRLSELPGRPKFGIKELTEIGDFFRNTAKYIDEYLQQELAEFDWQAAA